MMLTGGITRRETAEKALANGAAMVGMATALAVTPDLPDRWRAGRIVRGRRPALGTHPVHAVACDQLAQRRALRRYRSSLQATA